MANESTHVTFATAEDDRETVKVFVRLARGDDDRSRVITFKRPDRIPVKELLHLGLAIDGNQVMFEIGKDWADEVGGYLYPTFGKSEFLSQKATSLGYALSAAEVGLTDFLNKHGYDVEFA